MLYCTTTKMFLKIYYYVRKHVFYVLKCFRCGEDYTPTFNWCSKMTSLTVIW